MLRALGRGLPFLFAFTFLTTSPGYADTGSISFAVKMEIASQVQNFGKWLPFGAKLAFLDEKEGLAIVRIPSDPAEWDRISQKISRIPGVLDIVRGSEVKIGFETLEAASLPTLIEPMWAQDYIEHWTKTGTQHFLPALPMQVFSVKSERADWVRKILRKSSESQSSGGETSILTPLASDSVSATLELFQNCDAHPSLRGITLMATTDFIWTKSEHWLAQWLGRKLVKRGCLLVVPKQELDLSNVEGFAVATSMDRARSPVGNPGSGIPMPGVRVAVLERNLPFEFVQGEGVATVMLGLTLLHVLPQVERHPNESAPAEMPYDERLKMLWAAFLKLSPSRNETSLPFVSQWLRSGMWSKLSEAPQLSPSFCMQATQDVNDYLKSHGSGSSPENGISISILSEICTVPHPKFDVELGFKSWVGDSGPASRSEANFIWLSKSSNLPSKTFWSAQIENSKNYFELQRVLLACESLGVHSDLSIAEVAHRALIRHSAPYGAVGQYPNLGRSLVNWVRAQKSNPTSPFIFEAAVSEQDQDLITKSGLATFKDLISMELPSRADQFEMRRNISHVLAQVLEHLKTSLGETRFHSDVIQKIVEESGNRNGSGVAAYVVNHPTSDLRWLFAPVDGWVYIDHLRDAIKIESEKLQSLNWEFTSEELSEHAANMKLISISSRKPAGQSIGTCSRVESSSSIAECCSLGTYPQKLERSCGKPVKIIGNCNSGSFGFVWSCEK